MEIEQQKEGQKEDATKFSLKLWWNKVQCAQTVEESVNSYEEGLFYIPGCYKLWWNYLGLLVEELGSLEGILVVAKGEQVVAVQRVFERALIFMHKMPRIWIMYAQLLMRQGQVTATRRVLDRALEGLPVTQHEKIWSVQKEWVVSLPLVSTAKMVMGRYFQLRPDAKESFVDYLIAKEDYDGAVVYMKQMVDDEQFVSEKGWSEYSLLLEMCTLLSKHGGQIQSVDAESVIRHGIRKYTDEVGNLWVCLAEYSIRQGLFHQARDVFEEALTSIYTVRDFALIFNSYIQFEQQMLSLLPYQVSSTHSTLQQDQHVLQVLGLATHQQQQQQQQQQQVDNQLQQDQEVELRIVRLERLLYRRPLLVNNCLLRKNRHNVKEWKNRFDLLKDRQGELVECFGEALTEVKSGLAVEGCIAELWLYVAQYYRKEGDLTNSNLILWKAIQQEGWQLKDYLTIWLFWAETLIQEGFYSDAFILVKHALFGRQAHPLQDQFRLSLPLWAFYLDLEINLGSVHTVKATYQKILELKVITPLIMLNYIDFLEKEGLFEDSYKVVEMGLGMFKSESNYILMGLYLFKFMDRYQGCKLERTRDLFEKALALHPSRPLFYRMYAQFEEHYGLLNHAIEVLDRMTKHSSNTLQSYYLYIAKVAQYLGVTKTRPVFEKALKELKGDEMVEMALKYCDLEVRLGEIERARGILGHISQYVSIVDDSVSLWTAFEEFEKSHGNVDTYKDFLRLKRAVSVKFSLNPPDVNRILQKLQREHETETLQQQPVQ